MNFVRVAEVFESIQGESTYAGFPCFFVRLSGCNLRCVYCDTKRAYRSGKPASIRELVRRCRGSGAPLAEITGGEPLLQDGFRELALALRDRTRKKVLVETNGSADISAIPAGVVAVVDVKTPGSGEAGSFELSNIRRLRKYDEIKFVICDRNDYRWACRFVERQELARRCAAVLFSPAHGMLKAGDLARWMVRDGVPARLQVQLHKKVGLK
jgi:7-carboxy-7-deazaguanine synthase